MNCHTLIITGTSTGIGHELALLALHRGYDVIGIGRTANISHPCYSHIVADLSQISVAKSILMPELEEHTQSITLVNNSGKLGAIKPLHLLPVEGIEEVINLNYMAAMILSHHFIAKYIDLPIAKTLINISSGAATSAYASWANYCASKAALEMFTKVIRIEQSKYPHPIQAYAIAPGVVDTPMQSQIRLTDQSDFELVSKFVNMYQNQQLLSPHYVAQKLLEVIQNTDDFPEPIFRIT